MITNYCIVNYNVQIREMAFVFEINHISVKQYLAKIATKSEGHANLELAPEGVS